MLSNRFLFRFAMDCLYKEDLWSDEGAGLDDRYRLIDPTRLDGNESGKFDFRIAWSERGIALALCLVDKHESPWCRQSQPEESDGLQVWIDTRDVHSVHRASKFCHRFLFMPSGSGSELKEPVVQRLPINRAKAQPNPINEGLIKARTLWFSDGYQIDAFIPSLALTGYDPEQYPRLGFNFSVHDREVGDYVFSAGSPMPYKEDPSLWSTLQLVR